MLIIPLVALYHISRLCKDVDKSVDLYVNIIGFVKIKRPPSLDFDGAWVFNYGIGIHLVQSKEEERLSYPEHNLDPMDNHISFQCEDMSGMERNFQERNIKYKKRTVGYICNCENLKLVPVGNIDQFRLPSDRHNPLVELNNHATD
ncbi:hypothetical protein MKX03_031214 [Papaver bracteatum]|nr:hypothetical protein MKX03_031214 [Papaver bracteatum]